MISPTTYFFVRKEEKEDVSEKKRLKRGILKEKRKRRKKRRSGIPDLDTSVESVKAIENMFRNNYELTEIWMSNKFYSIQAQSRFKEIAKQRAKFNIFFFP
jgi:hypothetical protein